MARDENPPFGLGATAEAAASTDLEQWVGKEWIFEDRDPTTLAIRTNMYKRCRLVRNVSAGVLLPKRLVTLKRTAGKNASEVDGYSFNWAEQAFPVDEFLPAAGVAVNDIFWIVIEGPALVLTDLAAAANPVIGVHNWLVSLTAASSGATTAGRVVAGTFGGATTPLADQIMNRLGQAMTARTTANTNTDVLINMGQW
jgi:hypothetical protein